MRGKERELIVLRSENGETWKEHQYDSRHENLNEILNGMNEGKYIPTLFWLIRMLENNHMVNFKIQTKVDIIPGYCCINMKIRIPCQLTFFKGISLCINKPTEGFMDGIHIGTIHKLSGLMQLSLYCLIAAPSTGQVRFWIQSTV